MIVAKRPRSGSFVVAGRKRPVEKAIRVVATDCTNTQVQSTLFTAGEALTFSGGHISVKYTAASASPAGSGTFIHAAIVFVREGQAASTLSMTLGQALYVPEQDVLWAGVGVVGSNNDLSWEETKIKTQRKMKSGDFLAFNARSDSIVTGT